MTQSMEEAGAVETARAAGQGTALVIVPAANRALITQDEQSQTVAAAYVVEEDPRTPDEKLMALWLHGRSLHTQRAYRADVLRFLHYVRKPLRAGDAR